MPFSDLFPKVSQAPSKRFFKWINWINWIKSRIPRWIWIFFFCFEFLWIPSNAGRQIWKGPFLLGFNLMNYQCALDSNYEIYFWSVLKIVLMFKCQTRNSNLERILLYMVRLLEWPMLWRITKNSLHNEGTCKWVNWAPIFFWYKLLPTTSGPQKFPKIRFLKVNFFHIPMHLTNE